MTDVFGHIKLMMSCFYVQEGVVYGKVAQDLALSQSHIFPLTRSQTAHLTWAIVAV